MAAKYWTYTQMWQELRSLKNQFPDFVEIAMIGQSRQGRDMAGVTLTNRATGDPLSKSALLVDANIHAGEVAGNAVAMYWMRWCLTQYGINPEATELLDRHTVYVVPRISLDGAELYLTTPQRVRSSPHSYPYSSPPPGFYEDDVDGDGQILFMRVTAEDGGYVPDEMDSRVMRPRRPGESGGTYYHVFPEGRIDRTRAAGEWPIMKEAVRARRYDMDFNRNFPVRWTGESGQPGAGPFPLSEPELRNLVEFIRERPNIAAYVALHTSGGVILRQPSTGEDTTLSEEDRELYTRVAEMGAQVSGYFADSNYHIFASGHEPVLMPGAADDWMYDHLGVLSFTVEIWNLPRHAGARGYAELGMKRLMQLSSEEALEDERKIYAWVTKEVPDDGVFEWRQFNHPDFGMMEIGGLNPKFVVQNPPLHLLEEECAHVGGFLTRLGLCTPRLVVTNALVQPMNEGLYRVVLEVANAGFLPTASTAQGENLQLERLKAELSGDIEIVAGTSPFEIKHLWGYGCQTRWSPPHRQRAFVEWVVRAPAGTLVVAKLGGARAGAVSQSLVLGGDV